MDAEILIFILGFLLQVFRQSNIALIIFNPRYYFFDVEFLF